MPFKNFREVFTGIDPAPLLRQLSDLPTASASEECFPYDPYRLMWRKETEWTTKKRGMVVYDQYNIVLRYLTLGQDSNFPERIYLHEGDRDRDNWDRPAFSILSEARPIVQRLLAAVGDHLGHVIITRMFPGETLGTHIDHWPIRYWQRYQVPLSVAPDCRFNCGDEETWMRPGSAYWFANRLPHSVENGKQERISMIVEIRPFKAIP